MNTPFSYFVHEASRGSKILVIIQVTKGVLNNRQLNFNVLVKYFSHSRLT